MVVPHLQLDKTEPYTADGPTYMLSILKMVLSNGHMIQERIEGLRKEHPVLLPRGPYISGHISGRQMEENLLLLILMVVSVGV